jgi:hypothetical protein
MRGRVFLIDGNVHYDQKVASMLGLPIEKVRIIRAQQEEDSGEGSMSRSNVFWLWRPFI